MELLADRFLWCGDNQAIDLATAARVHLVISAQGGTTEQARWAARCARVSGVRHPAMAVLVDYGALDATRRFEAWRAMVDAHDSAVGAEADAARQSLTAFLHAIGLSVGTLVMARDRQRAVAILNESGGYEDERPASALIAGMAPGLVVIPRQSVTVIEQMLLATTPTTRAISLWGAERAGVDTAFETLARAARLQGVVPVCAAALTDHSRPLLSGRSTMLLARHDPASAWKTWLDLSLRSRRRHLLVCAAADDCRGMTPVVLERFSAEALVQSVVPSVLPEPLHRRVLAAAHDARGLPGAFAERLWGLSTDEAPRSGSPATRAAEPSVEYGAPRGREPVRAREREWPASADLLECRERVRRACADLLAGKFAAGERHLRQGLGQLERRRDWRLAAEGTIVLAEALLRRGRVKDAGAALAAARGHAYAADDSALLLRAAIGSGRQAVDQLLLDDAEAVLVAALATARGLGDTDAQRTVALELARCYVWRGRFDDAQQVLRPFHGDGARDAASIAVAVLGSRVALGEGHLPDAVALAARAVAAAEGQPPAIGAVAWSALALTHLAVGDADAVARDCREASAAVRRAHDPLRALSIRLIAAEACRRTGQRGAAARLVARLSGIRAPQLPPLLRARVSLLSTLLKDDGPESVTKLVAATGLGGLVLFAPRPRPASGQQALTAHLLEVLRCCQAADDDLRILHTLCTQLRPSLQADAVGVFVEERGQLMLVASNGGRLDPVEANRVRQSSEPVGPRNGDARGSAGGIQVRWGGQTIGVLAVAWPAEARAPHADPLLSAASVAMAPALAAERLRRQRPPDGIPELLGVSAAMAEVRSTIERAAPAPFAVLIEGESGSGKELVARALHRRSPRRDRACCAVNCAALPDDLLESELFGHARGAFTGAMAERVGVFEEAHGGTLFLDEVGELSARAQAKLLRAIQEGEIRRVGENTPRRVDVRLVAATNRRLHEEVTAGRFRQDLLYRLDVIRITLPPLRQRADDVALLAEHFWRDAITRLGSRATLGVATLAALARYDWPGNVRELQNVLAALAVRVPRRGVVSPAALPSMFHGHQAERSWRLDSARRTFETAFVRAALTRSGGHRMRAAQDLGVTRQGLAKLIARLGLD